MRMTILTLAALSAALAGCGGSSSSTNTDNGNGGNTDVAVSIPFTATVGTEPFACGQVYNSVGTANADVVGHDARFFVHDIRFITNDNREIPVTLDGNADGQASSHQRPGAGEEGIALIDLRDRNAGCTGDAANTEFNNVVTGTAAIRNESLRGLAFVVGVPSKYNHINADGTQPQIGPDGEPIPGTIATGPLLTGHMMSGGMQWGWTSGYVHARLEVNVPTAPFDTFFIHLGSTGCQGDYNVGQITCSAGNRPEVMVEDFDLSLHAINIDFLRLLGGTDVTINQAGANGCMSAENDPDCLAIFERLKLPFPGADPDASNDPVFYPVTVR